MTLQNGCTRNNALYSEYRMNSGMTLAPQCVMLVAMVTVVKHLAVKRPKAFQLELQSTQPIRASSGYLMIQTPIFPFLLLYFSATKNNCVMRIIWTDKLR